MYGTPLFALNWKNTEIKRKINSEKGTNSLYIVILAMLYRCLEISNASFAPLPLRRLNELQRSSFRRQFLLGGTTFHKGVRQPVGSFGFVS